MRVLRGSARATSFMGSSVRFFERASIWFNPINRPAGLTSDALGVRLVLGC